MGLPIAPRDFLELDADSAIGVFRFRSPRVVVGESEFVEFRNVAKREFRSAQKLI